MNDRTFRLGRELLPNSEARPDLLLPPHHFVSHGVVVGMAPGVAGLGAELASAPAATIERTIRPKKDAVTVEGYAILWMAH